MVVIEASLSILKENTQKKLELLDHILEKTYLLEEAIVKSPFSYDLVNDIISQKSILVKELEQLEISNDQYVNTIIVKSDNQYKSEILIIQDLLKQLMDKSIKLSDLESSVKAGFDELRSKQKSDIQKYYVNKKITSNYISYQNINTVESIFFDKKN